ncbi:hypothetical protein L198_07028 [Cryptococcus wingfieldii CBS 7118]|uniref:Helitron helicase-like domain-containing protein n=1 Tax=Cryptococcus wingfieldii CBS 7118 TaxID=1295528 RepID=A0A1E3IFL2_9TREE|nr:hypothetical protein L198_07028 [Cryptococcus wingfieldii CBS 7118]ODN87404.1 hypothetical protein L198_07028 [Cryptococcus wingfieldii CBS 7118]
MQGKLKPGVRFVPESEQERAAVTLLRKLNIMSTNIFGSAGSHKDMREELRALLRHSGMPSLFVTLNPADAMNPIVGVFSGRDINLDERLGTGEGVSAEAQARSRAAALDPGACAEGFHFMVEKFVDIFLAYDDPHRGIFGKCLHHYGVVEAQGRGALHMLICIL